MNPTPDPTGTPRCLCIDLEVGRSDGQIHQFAALRSDTGDSMRFSHGRLPDALERLDALADGAAFLLGHNLTAFDRPYLQASAPELRLLSLPDVDTLKLNPLAFPRNPYHHLVKHYQDGALRRGHRNDPEQDVRLTMSLFADQRAALFACHEEAPRRVLAWHFLTTGDLHASGLHALFASIRRRPRPTVDETREAIASLLRDSACRAQLESVLDDLPQHGWPLAYALAWLSVAGGNSVLSPWVLHNVPETARIVRRLRDTPCGRQDCAWCRERHDAVRELHRWFGLAAYRVQPAAEDGGSLQQAIVEAAMRGEHLLGILPTGTGKSLCYQVPALSRYDKTGALSVVISPLVALMADQVAGMEARGLTSCVAVNGLLSPPERSDALDRIRLGDVAIVIISPEQLRSTTVRRVLAQREIGAWVLDEAHCLSKWGHDFRPDYRYVGRYMRTRAGDGPIPPVQCLTATAKPDVVAEILGYFQDTLNIELAVFDGGANRTNLDFVVVPTNAAGKLSRVHQLLEHDLPASEPGGAIVYCSSRRRTEELAHFLREQGIEADCFHAGLMPESKKDVQRRFVRGELRVIVATNAFGMGIDKPDVRIVVHADMPGSLENYIQEAGRAGRDQRPARCVLLYDPQDVEWQFGLSARSRLSRREIAAILKALRRLDRGKTERGTVVATAGEILLEEQDGTFVRDSATEDTRVRTAVAWLEESGLLRREENVVQVFPSSLRVASLDEARTRLQNTDLFGDYRNALLKIVQALFDTDADQGVSTDDLMAQAGLGPGAVRKALFDLETLGIASNDTVLTAFVHHAVEDSSARRFEHAAALEKELIGLLREDAPDLGPGDVSPFHLRVATQRLKDLGHAGALPERVWRIVRSLARDGRDDAGSAGSFTIKRLDAETSRLTLNRGWATIEKAAQLRRDAAVRLLEHLLTCLPATGRGKDLLAQTTLGKLRAALNEDLLVRAQVRDPGKLLDRALLWLHEQEIVRLNKGLAVFRSAMTIHLEQPRRGFSNTDFEPLKLHYDEQVVQIHVMAEYVQRGLEAMADALRLAMDYFNLPRDEFLSRWLASRERELSRQTTPQSWHTIVEALGNTDQQRIVADDRERTNVLVLAGPGSGKTRVLVHRIAYLLQVRRERAHGILALAYNRHAAVQIRRRLVELVGDDARGVTVMTCHALAMRLTGSSFERRLQADDAWFDQVMQQAIALLEGEDLAPEDADEQRARLLGGFRWILVDEYQDIETAQYALIAALAGRRREDADGQLTLFAVGDDDQNIYGFAGASVEFIRRFEADYDARAAYLVENYRSTANIIAVANALIALAPERMKSEHPIVINQRRRNDPAGGQWHARDPLARGRVQILPVGTDMMSQAIAVMNELQRFASLAPDWDWSKVAVIARHWRNLDPVQAWCELHAIPAQRADESLPQFWRVRETQALLDWLRQQEQMLVHAARLHAWLDAQPMNPWFELLREAVAEYADEIADAELPREHFVEWLAEWGREARRRRAGLLLSSAHAAKGLEFDHVAVLDGGWSKGARGENPDAQRRLYYVAMTRAKHTLLLARMASRHPLLDALGEDPALLQRTPMQIATVPAALARRYLRLSLRDVDLGFAGRLVAANPVHRAIGALQPGDPLTLRNNGRALELLDDRGTVVGRLARSFEPPRDMQAIRARVAAIVCRRRDDGRHEPGYANRSRCDAWEVVVPDLVYASAQEAAGG